MGGEFGEYRADLFIFEHYGMVMGQTETSRVGALEKLLERLKGHLANWQLKLALAGQ